MKKYLNCFTYIFKPDGRVLWRKGIKGELNDGMILFNGLGKYRTLFEPAAHNDDDYTDENLIRIFQELHEQNRPWIAKEDDGVYLYSASFDEINRYFHPYHEEDGRKDYVLIEAPSESNVSWLGGGDTLLFRYFEGGKQYAMFKLDSDFGGVIKYSGDKEFVLLEYLGERSFTLR